MATALETLQLAAEGKGCLGKAAHDEPVFVLRAQDMLAAPLVEQWAMLAKRNGCDPTKVAEAYRISDQMRAWPNRKMPT